MDQQIYEFSTIVRGVQTTNKEILVQLKSIQEQDSQVCTCTCHSSDSSLKEELEEHKTRIKALENIVQELLTRDRHNATDEYKSRTGVRNDRTHNADQDPSAKTCNRPKAGQGATTSVRSIVEKTGVKDTQTESQTSSTRSKERLEEANSAKMVPEAKHKLADQVGVGASSPQDTSITNRDNLIARPNVQQKSITSAVRNATSKTEPPTPANRIAVRSRIGDNKTTAPSGEGATTITCKEEDNYDVEVIHQDEVRYFANSADWVNIAGMELESGIATAIKDLEGSHTAICLDISESMAQGDAWRQAKMFLVDYFDGLSKMAREHNVTDEYVSLVTFGHDTRVVKRLTNKYDELRRALECVKLGGPSPMFGGLYMALVSLMQSKHWTTTVNGFTVYSKIILISDGKVTDTRQQAGPDVMESKEEYTTDLFNPLRDIVTKRIEIYCVPVGTANMTTMDMMAAEEGTIWPCDDGSKLAKRYFLTKSLGPGITRSLFGPTFNPNFKSECKLEDSDRLHMLEIFDEANRRQWEDIARARELEDVYYDSNRDRLLPVGSRVRRGPDWNNDDEDGNGPGTVVGHNRFADKVFVHWDAGKIYLYSYGDGNSYEVFPADDVSQPKPGESLVIGCVVKPTGATKDKNPDIQAFDRGVVVRITSDHKVTVKWNSGKSGIYIVRPGGTQEVEFCGSMEVPAPVVQKKVPERQHSRNKNKNK